MLSGCRRPGATLAELLVALTLAGVVLGTAASTLRRQQRTASSLSRAAGGDAQLRAAVGALAVELGALTAGSGDLEPGQLSDTAVQLRSLVASGLSCGDALSSATFVGEADVSPDALLGSAPRQGDSLWWFGGAPVEWRVRRILTSDSLSAPCPLIGAPPGPARRIVIAEPDSIPYGAPLRVTRPLRYAFYRSGDGSWQLGVRDWSEATGRFASPQPIAGPFLMHAGSARTGFRFYDADGVELGTDGTPVASVRVARVRITAVAADPMGSGGAGGGAGRDSLDVTLQPAGVP
jgi:type II secretory pathway pseudopilin PulG